MKPTHGHARALDRLNPPPVDFDNSYIHPTERRWTTDDHIAEHAKFCAGLEDWLRVPANKKVVISHFVPHPDASDPRFKDNPLNPYFISHMRRYFDDVNVWLFGHTHSSCDTVIGGCRLVCNPHGYGSENINGFRRDLIVEI